LQHHTIKKHPAPPQANKAQSGVILLAQYCSEMHYARNRVEVSANELRNGGHQTRQKSGSGRCARLLAAAAAAAAAASTARRLMNLPDV
jgi:hypothetical protein